MTHLSEKFDQLLTAIFLLILSLLVGIIGFMYFEDYNLSEAIYMTVITVSTVGFGEIHPISEVGRIFVSLFIVFNLTVFGYFISVTSKFLFEGELKDIFNSILSDREMENLSNHVIVCGCGRNGFKACQELIESKVKFVLIDDTPNIVQERFGDKAESINHILGDATEEEILIKAGIKKAKAIIAAVSQDSTNVFISLSARELNPSINIIARAMQESSESKLHRAGANHVVMPDSIGGHYMATIVNKPHVVHFLDMINGIGEIKLELEEIGYNDFKTEFRGKSIRDIDVRSISPVTIIGYKSLQLGYVFNPNSAAALHQEEYFIVLGKQSDLNDFKKHFTTLNR